MRAARGRGFRQLLGPERFGNAAHRLGDDEDGRQRMEYRSIGRGFIAELLFDSDGLVVDHPHLAQSVDEGLATSPLGREVCALT